MTADRERREITEFLTPGGSSLTLLTNLRALSEELSPYSARQAVTELADRVEQGEAMETAFSQVRDRLPSEMRLWCELGISHQRLDVLIALYMDHLRRRSDLQRSIWVSLAYPVGLIGLSVLMGLGLSFVAIPMFETIYADFRVELPGATKIVLGLSHLVRFSGFWILMALALSGVLWWAIARAAGVRKPFQFLFRSIPGFGTAFRWSSLASCSELLAMLIEIEASLPVALRTAANTTDDADLSARLNRAASDAEAGILLTPSSDQVTSGLPPELAGAFRWTHQSSLLASTLRTYSEIFSVRSRVDLHLLLWVMEPFVLLFIAIIVGFSFAALLLPLIHITSDLS